MKVVVDTNIVFSTLLNTKGTIGDLIFNSDDYFTFYSCSYMRFEIQKHWQKLLKISKMSDAEMHVSYDHVISKIKFINEELIPLPVWQESEILLADIDLKESMLIGRNPLNNDFTDWYWGGRLSNFSIHPPVRKATVNFGVRPDNHRWFLVFGFFPFFFVGFV